MDHRSSARGATRRQPLGDATQRVNNANLAQSDLQHGSDKENYPPSLKPQKKSSQARSNSAVAFSQPPAEQHGSHSQAMAARGDAVLVNPRLSVIAQESIEMNDPRRVSQFSTASSNASSSRQLKTFIGPWQLGKTLGKGTSARVRLARHRVSHQLAAVKIVAKSTAHIAQADSLANLDRINPRKPTTAADGGVRRMPLAIEREVAILKIIQHPNIIKLHDIWENRSEIYLVTEYVEKGDLFEFINWSGRLHEEEAIYYFRQIMSALQYCHSFNICHRDLKPENILLKDDGQIKIADFGLAALQQDASHRLKTACGSPHYAAPELIRHQFYKGSSVDIWSMGVILFAMLSASLPFDDDDMNVMLTRAKRAEYRMPPNLSKEAKDLIKRILVVNPSHRITMKQMWKHPLIKKYDYLDDLPRRDALLNDTLQNACTEPVPESQVDAQILRQLRSLWHAWTDAQLIQKLGETNYNEHKGYYWLLYNHRESQLENYNNDIPISKSDFHHLKPPNWKKKISTCEFTQPGRSGHVRSVSRFTVISNIPEADDTGTVHSYDPYNASRVLRPCGSQVSHARITVHRNTPDPGVPSSFTSVSRSYHSYLSVDGSFRDRPRMNSQRTNTTGHLKSPFGSMGSIKSHNSTSRARVGTRPKRGIDFSNVRNKSRERRRGRSMSITSESTTYGRPSMSPSRSAQAKSTPLIEVEKPKDDSIFWNDELLQLGHRIARDCDEAFSSSVLGSYPSEGTSFTRGASPFSISLGTPSPGYFPETPISPVTEGETQNNYDNRPLPPVPSEAPVTPSSHPIYGDNVQPIGQSKNFTLHSMNTDLVVPERRTVSEPVYMPSGREVRPLPSIRENTSEDWRNSGHNRATPVPIDTPGPVDKSLDYLSRVENSIRVVNSPTGQMRDQFADVPKPLNIRKTRPGPQGSGNPSSEHPHQDDTRQSSGEAQKSGQESGDPSRGSSQSSKMRMPSWFRRASKDDTSSQNSARIADNSIRSKEVLRDLDVNQLPQPASSQQEKKKPFRLSFWKNSKPDPKRFSLESDEGDLSAARKTGSRLDVWRDNEGGGREIEVHQSWFERLLRVKPAMRHLCFTIPRRRVRQEIAILLKEWRQYGIKDIEINKERNLVFARVDAKNILNMKAVSFAIEIMMVIEHGKRSQKSQLAIARFTQEKGAASSFHKVVDAFQKEFTDRQLIVADKQKINMMIKTLNAS